jgi:hypothetical protein
MEAEFRESHPCDKKNCIKFGVWISKVPERGMCRVIQPGGVQAELCKLCKHWKGLNHYIPNPEIVEPAAPESVPRVKNKGGRPRKKPVREVKDG